MTTLKFCMLAVTGVAAAMIVKQWKSDFLPLIRLARGLLFGVAVITAAAPLVSYLSDLTGTGGISQYATVLMKALGIAVLTQCCSEICRECGESGAASGVELTGKVEILLLCLPLINEILSAAEKLLTLGT